METYSAFLQDFEQELKSMKPCKAAKEYYLGHESQMYLFDEMHVCAETRSLDSMDDNDNRNGNERDEIKRRPKMDNLYDVFVAIRNDEMEHVKTMNFLQNDGDFQICNIG